MPNWCYNKVHITGDDLASLIDFITRKIRETGGDFSFEWIVPPPVPPVAQPRPTLDDLSLTKTAEDLRNVLEAMQQPAEAAFDWYNWNIQNWGTKWDADNPKLKVDPDAPPKYVTLRFETAWSPSLSVTQQFSVMFPTAVFEHTYGEPGCDFSGCATYEDGSLLEHAQSGFMDSEWYDPADYSED